jgi:hypothetical protein
VPSFMSRLPHSGVYPLHRASHFRSLEAIVWPGPDPGYALLEKRRWPANTLDAR